ncbi:hypothetical protein [Algibacter sp. L3A6]|uniref:hypothetical protein n=1 Tax=Algibacter sp. L3A6 TaxID=2686366 RepID=UPI00131BB14F|nr:hypothetical protein [Algibacter sp. L3A6]
MEKTSIILLAISLFIAITFLYWRLTRAYAEKEYGKNIWKQWGTRTFYWQGALYFSGGLTVALIFVLKSASVLIF